MRHVVGFLPFITRGLAICAVLAGLGAGFLEGIAGDFVCVDSCPTRDFYFSYLGPTAVRLMTPCVVLAALTAAVFLLYCLATRQIRRAVLVLIVLLVGGLVCIAGLDALLLQAQADLPSGSQSEGGILLEGSVEVWAEQWAWALALAVGAWSGVLAYLQWRR
jgi:hypothetical protein